MPRRLRVIYVPRFIASAGSEGAGAAARLRHAALIGDTLSWSNLGDHEVEIGA
jgi:hypothetical protein